MSSVPLHVVARGVFDTLVSVMGSDNGVVFRAALHDYDEAVPAVADMITAGYFCCPDNDLDGDYWQMAAGEESEVAQRFSRAPDAFEKVSSVLNDIFDRPLDEVPVHG